MDLCYDKKIPNSIYEKIKQLLLVKQMIDI